MLLCDFLSTNGTCDDYGGKNGMPNFVKRL